MARHLPAACVMAALLGSGCTSDVRVLRTVEESAVTDGGGDPCHPPVMPFGERVIGQSGSSLVVTSTPPEAHVSARATWTLALRDENDAVFPATTQLDLKCFLISAAVGTVDVPHGCSGTIVVEALGGGRYRAAPIVFPLQGVYKVTVYVGDIDHIPITVCAE